ncbi:MAG: hypothetical protein HYR60_24995, partial [Acidobacteria bacterium]|nr:hypothetical protein [Acidobacteriota bacterium]
GQQGQANLNVAITGQFTNFVQGTSTASFGAGITVNSFTVSNATSGTANISIANNAAVGARNVTVTTGAEVVTLNNGFTVTAGTPVITQVNPNTGQQGQANLNVAITGQFTNFVQGTSSASFGAGITVNSFTVSNATSGIANISVAANAALGARTVTVTTGAEVVTLNSGFTVTAGTPVLTQVNPNSGQQGQANLNVAITGQFTNFVQGTSTASFGAGITVNSFTVSNAASGTANISVAANAALGARTVTVTTGTEVASLANSFTVQASNAIITSVNPNSGLQGQAVQVTITGQNTHFLQGTTQARFGPSISVGGGIAGDFGPVTVTGPTTAIAQLSILPSALPSPRSVTAQTGSEQASLTNGFTVLGIPTISSVSPSSAQQGQNPSVTITGVFTNFVQGVTQASFGAGISVGGGAAGGFGPVTVNSPTSATAQLSVGASAALGVRTPTVQTGMEQASLANGFSVFGPITGAPPTVTITAPAEGSEVTTQTNVIGTVTSPNLNNWILDYRQAGGSTFTPFATGTTSAVSGSFDPTLLLNDIYEIRLTGVDTSGQTSATTVHVAVTRNQKVGNFTVSFNDLSVPVAGLPIQVVRTYDSRDKRTGDFGVGWTLDLKTVRTSVSGVMGDDWTGTKSGGFLPTYCVQPAKAHVVTITFTDGTVYEFQAVPSPQTQCQQIVPPQSVDMIFTPTGSTPPNASLTTPGGSGLFVIGSFPGSVTLLDLGTVASFDPDQFLLTMPDGRVLTLSRQFGLQSMRDTNGNQLTIGTNGISHSSGKNVTFLRDGQGRITRITDPAGNPLNYSYNPAGDLASFSDQENNTTTYTYNSTHGLLEIRDPRGIMPVRNDYDASGRLVSHTDAFGNVINYTHSTGTRQEIVTDRLNNVTVNEYDTAGNIIKVTDAVGSVTTRTFDARGNMLSETNALGQTRTLTFDAQNNRLTETDPLGNITRYTYNSRNQLLTSTDPLGSVTTTNTYDASGNLTSTKDALNGVTGYTYTTAGLRASMTDPLGNVTTYQYDGAGNLTRQTDPLGNITTYTYDVNGNKLTETRTRTTPAGPETLVTSFQYDRLNRLVKTTYPDGTTAQVQYNVIGKQSVVTDQLGHQTNYQYDLGGRLIQTTFPDGTTESTADDAEGHRITSTNRANRTTAYTYDALGRLTRTTFPDGSSTSAAYDANGRVTQVTDARGNVTRYTYDAAGRRTQVSDALNNLTTFGYDQAGNQTSMTDARGNTTQYQYDSNLRRTRVNYPDGTTEQVVYDALGRTTSKTDQAGKTTQFQYDKLGRLTAVIDALNQTTSYGYDEAGNRISQTDALGRVTRFEYDKLGRRTKRTLPLGMSETFAYDAAGNQTSRTDFRGKTTTYSYDALNRLLSKTPDPTLNEPGVNFTYTATGQRASMSDASGITTYTYDLRDRLLNKSTPQGTLTYTYDLQGNLTSIRSSNAGGTSVDYAYDALNRLSRVTDNRLAPGVTTYTYDAVGNLAGYAYPNGAQSTYTYNNLNRLTNLATARSATPLATYAYTLGAAGNRTAVSELSGRQVNYVYDSLYRLTNETIAGGTVNGAIGYTYDAVGNRLTRTSTVGPVPPAAYTYDANDRLTIDTYDLNGNTAGSGGNNYTYDFENHLKTQNGGAVTFLYNGDGNRVSKTSGGTTTYLVDDRNLTGYSQVLEEIAGGAIQRVYTYGLNRISQSQAGGASFYVYDGHGSVRLLTDAAGAATDRYDYDAFGNVTASTGGTPNVYLYAGEQLDPNVGAYYLRARYYKTDAGRFLTLDPWAGDTFEPATLHRYTYARNDPVNRIDPSGLQEFTLAGLSAAVSISQIISVMTPTLIQGAIIIAGIQIFWKPGFALRNAALEAMATGTLGTEGWAAAERMYRNGALLIQLGAFAIDQGVKIAEIIQFGLGVKSLAKAILNAPRLTITAVEITQITTTSTSIEVTGTSLLIRVQNSSITIVRTLAGQFTNWAESIFEGTKLILDIMKKAVEGSTE